MSNRLAKPEGAESVVEGDPEGAAIRALDARYVMHTYARQEPVFVRGEGARLWDSEGREYLDFLSGIAVVGVGHCHPRVSAAIAAQAQTLMHVSNLYYNPLQPRLAERLCALTGMERAFFCNSGAEANEAALKIARKWGKVRRGAECMEIITFEGSFHGRTMGTVSATAQPKYQDPFRPLVPGFHYCPRNSLTGLDSLISEKTCAVMIEPIQGESGVHAASPEFLAGVRALCDEAEVLLILDEVQSGMGRTGRFLASQTLGVRGDVVTLAKGIADGFPMGVCLAGDRAAETLVPGDHGSTFGGQPLACAAALATLDVLEEEALLENAGAVGDYLLRQLRQMALEHSGIAVEVRGCGLMAALELSRPVARQARALLLDEGIVVNAVGDTILRLLPPLIVGRQECDRFLCALQNTLRSL